MLQSSKEIGKIDTDSLLEVLSFIGIITHAWGGGGGVMAQDKKSQYHEKLLEDIL
jgi:hypothetical protein